MGERIRVFFDYLYKWWGRILVEVIVFMFATYVTSMTTGVNRRWKNILSAYFFKCPSCDQEWSDTFYLMSPTPAI